MTNAVTALFGLETNVVYNFSLSLTGKLLYHVVDLFVVHWETLQKRYPRSKVVSTFVPLGKELKLSNTAA